MTKKTATKARRKQEQKKKRVRRKENKEMEDVGIRRIKGRRKRGGKKLTIQK